MLFSDGSIVCKCSNQKFEKDFEIVGRKIAFKWGNRWKEKYFDPPVSSIVTKRLGSGKNLDKFIYIHQAHSCCYRDERKPH